MMKYSPAQFFFVRQDDGTFKLAVVVQHEGSKFLKQLSVALNACVLRLGGAVSVMRENGGGARYMDTTTTLHEKLRVPDWVDVGELACNG